MKKSSNSKGFWGGVTVTPQGVTEEIDSYKVTPLVTPHQKSLQNLIKWLRSEWLRIPTKTGRPSKGPRYYAIVRCTYEDEIVGLTDSAQTKGKRWACTTCFSLCVPVWADGPVPDREEIEQEWADWAATIKETSDIGKTRTKLKAIGFLKVREI